MARRAFICFSFCFQVLLNLLVGQNPTFIFFLCHCSCFQIKAEPQIMPLPWIAEPCYIQYIVKQCVQSSYFLAQKRSAYCLI